LKRLQEILANGNIIIERGSPAESSPDLPAHRGPVFNAPVQPPKHHSLPSPLPTRQYTYAFQEVRFARRLQRYSLEHAYRLFAESSSDPGEIYRVFRLVPCVRDPDKTQPRFRQLLLGGCTDSLEVPGLPFYSIGGAGTHFPDVDGEGNAVYPANSRMPRRILGLLPWAELGTKGGGDPLEVFGLGGDWFDCLDVEGYLKLHGVEVDGGLFPALHIPRGQAESDSTWSSYVLDVEGFFSREFPIFSSESSSADHSRSSLWARHPRPCAWVQEDGR
jgi:hypothetical protein